MCRSVDFCLRHGVTGTRMRSNLFGAVAHLVGFEVRGVCALMCAQHRVCASFTGAFWYVSNYSPHNKWIVIDVRRGEAFDFTIDLLSDVDPEGVHSCEDMLHICTAGVCVRPYGDPCFLLIIYRINTA